MKYVMFGNQRHSAIYALRHGLNPRDIPVATQADVLRGVNEPVTAIRLPSHIWLPTTFPCENRVRETEAELKRIKQAGGTVIEEEMSL